MWKVRQPTYFDNLESTREGSKTLAKCSDASSKSCHLIIRMMLLFCKRGKTVLKKWINFFIFLNWASLIAQLVKNLPTTQETPVQFLGRENPLGYPLQYSWVSLVAQLVKNPPAMWDTRVWLLGWEDPLEKGKVTTPVFWPGEFHGLCSPWGRKELDMTEWLSLSYWWVNY